MPLTSKDRQWMQRYELFRDYVKIRDDFRGLGVSPHESINAALHQVSKGKRGSPYTAAPHDESNPDTPNVPPLAPAQLDAKFGEVSDDSSYVAIQWVGQHMWVADVKESDAPDSTAYGLLMRCQESPSFRDDFYTKLWGKTIPSQKQLDSQQRFRDNGSKLIALNAEIRRVLTHATPTPAATQAPNEALNTIATELTKAEISPF